METVLPGGSAPPARPAARAAVRARRRIRLDRWAARLVAVGGALVIAAILAILVVIVVEVLPLFRAPAMVRVGTHPPLAGTAAWRPADGEGFGVDEYREVAFAVDRTGAVSLRRLPDGEPLAPVPVPGLDGAAVTWVAGTGPSRFVLGTSDGRAIPFEVGFDVAYAEGRRTVTPRVAFGEAAVLDAEGRRPVRRLVQAAARDGTVTVAQVGPDELVLRAVVERRALVGPSTRAEARRKLRVEGVGEITGLAMDGRGEDLVLGTSRGRLVRYDLRAQDAPVQAETVEASAVSGVPITALGFLLGDRTLVVGDGAGGVSSWQVLPPPGGGERRLVRIHRFARHEASVLAFSASRRDKGFATADAAGAIHVSHGTSGRTLIVHRTAGGGVAALAYAPKADGLLALAADGTLAHFRLDNPHPEVTWRTLFGKVWYEGYPAPAYVWQSTGGTDDFEPKLSLTPLVFGTLKGTAYALLFAVPLALLAALYVSEFMHPTLRGRVKPVVEIMAALPSVVLGFVAGLWLAPVVERIVPGLCLAGLLVPAAVLGALVLWRAVPAGLRARVRAGTEVVLLVPVVALATWAAVALGELVEATLLGGSYREWLLSVLGVTYDQRNSLVVGLAMGFAVIPIIFTIAEDSLANVPAHLRAGSLALGATRWQTALRVVLPTASPGIFSAVMIGFGRAIGETMIVLMATGNTPVMDWSPFNGFRALSANIAVELPEAPEGGTLFRIIFLAALLLFGLTFVVNTAAELVRLRLRQRYRAL
jgi:phosphate transport system permease protein